MYKVLKLLFEKGYLKNWNSFIFDPLSHIFEKTEFGVHHRPQDVEERYALWEKNVRSRFLICGRQKFLRVL